MPDSSGMVSSGGVFSSQPRKILHSFQYTLLGRAKCTRDTRRNTSPSHTPAASAARPLVASHLRVHTLHSHTYPPPLPGHTLHALSVTVAKSRAHDPDPRPPARRPKRRPYGACLGPAQQRSPPGPVSLLRTGQTRSGLELLARSGRVLTAQGPLGNLVPAGTPAFEVGRAGC